LTFTNADNVDQTMRDQFSEIAQSCISWTFNWQAQCCMQNQSSSSGVFPVLAFL